MRFRPKFFYDQGDPGNPGNTTPPPAANQTPPPAAKTLTAEEIAASIVKVVDERTQRAEAGVVKTMAAQYGITEEDAKAALEKAKAEKAHQMAPEVQKKIDDANERATNMLLKAEFKLKGSDSKVGLADADSALALLNAEERAKIKVDDNGVVTGVEEAMKDQKARLPFLYNVRPANAMAGKVVGDGSEGDKSPADEIQARLFGTKS